jgi:hypothetical protein
MYNPENPQAHLSKAVQNFLICVEMFAASIAFTNSFSYQDYLSVAKTKVEDEMRHPVLTALQSSLNLPDDIFMDLRLQLSIHFSFV